MPKRKNKLDNLKELDFQESPLGGKPYLTPTGYPMNHPIEADTVNIASETTMSWVSPQFRDTQRSRRKLLRKRPPNSASQVNTDVTTAKPLSKTLAVQNAKDMGYVLLKFKNQSTTKPEGFNTNISKASHADSIEIKRSQLNQTVLGGDLSNLDNILQHDNDTKLDSEPPAYSQVHTPNMPDINTPEQHEHNKSSGDESNRLDANAPSSGAGASINNADDLYTNTQHLPNRKVKGRIRKNLFTRSPSSADMTDGVNGMPLQRSKLHLFAALENTPDNANSPKKNNAILAADTPVEEYGLTRRQRYLKRLTRQ